MTFGAVTPKGSLYLPQPRPPKGPSLSDDPDLSSGAPQEDGKTPEQDPGDGNGELTVRVDPWVGEDAEEDPEAVTLEADLVVLSAAQRPSGGSAELFRMFGAETYRYGFPIENQARLFRPT